MNAKTLITAGPKSGGLTAPLNKLKSATRKRRVPIPVRELLEKNYPERKWVIQDLLPPGIGFLAGRPKSGKSWLGIDIAISVASGRKLFDSIPVERGDVLLLSLEDSEKRLQDRISKVLGEQDIPENLHVDNDWIRLNKGGLEDIEHWVKNCNNPKLIIIDTWAKICPDIKSNDIYNQEYANISCFKPLVDQYGISILIIHHTRKASAIDPLDQVLGTTGTVGAADTVYILEKARGTNFGTILVSGRDIDERKIKLGFEKNQCKWTLAENCNEIPFNKTEQIVIDILKESGKGIRSGEIQTLAQAKGMNGSTCRGVLKRMLENEYLYKSNDDLYLLNDLTLTNKHTQQQHTFNITNNETAKTAETIQTNKTEATSTTSTTTEDKSVCCVGVVFDDLGQQSTNRNDSDFEMAFDFLDDLDWYDNPSKNTDLENSRDWFELPSNDLFSDEFMEQSNLRSCDNCAHFFSFWKDSSDFKYYCNKREHYISNLTEANSCADVSLR